MAVNKIVYSGKALIDLTSDSVTPETLLSGYIAHDKSGQIISGKLQPASLTVDSIGNGMITGAGITVSSTGGAAIT